VNLVDKQNVTRLEIGQDGNQVTLPLDRRPRRHPQADTHFGGYDRGEGRFAQPWRTVEQDVIQRLLTSKGSLDKDVQVCFDPMLPNVLSKPPRT
jgi:hypothetical protein